MAEREEFSVASLKVGAVTNLAGTDLDELELVATKSMTGGLAQDYNALFTTSGGPVLITQIYGYVDTVLASTASNGKLSTGIGTDYTDICAALEMNAAAAKSLLTITGTVTDAMVKSAATAIAVIGQAGGLVVKSGSTIYHHVVAAMATGAITWYVRYKPLAAGAKITAA